MFHSFVSIGHYLFKTILATPDSALIFPGFPLQSKQKSLRCDISGTAFHSVRKSKPTAAGCGNCGHTRSGLGLFVSTVFYKQYSQKFVNLQSESD